MNDPSKCKFSNKLAEKLYVRFSADEEIDVGDGMGWLGLFIVPSRGGAILHEDSQGFVTVDTKSSESDLWESWEEAKTTYLPVEEEPEDDDYIISRERGFFVSRCNTPRKVEALLTYRSCLLRIEYLMEEEKFWPNVWLASERGNYTKLELAKELANTDPEEDEN